MNCIPSRIADRAPAATHFSLSDVLSDIEPSLPESLFGEECRRQMHRVAERLPVRLSSFWGFECRLGEPEPFSDILFEIRKETPGPALMAGEPPSALDSLCETYPAWEKFRFLARDWINPGHPWNRDIRNLWLEMDLTGADAESVLRRPNIFFGPEPETPNERIFELIEELAFMFQRPASQTCALREFVDCLPYGARIFQIGFMLSRPDDVGMRLCVDKTETEPEKILDWLVKLRPAMNVTEAELLRRALEAVFPLCRDINFGFNLTKGGVDEALGVECYEDWINEDTAQWRPLLDEITRAQLCLPEKAQGVRDYAGITASQSHKRIDCGIIFLNTYRKIHHLKLTLSQGTLIQAKAYLSVSRPGLPLSLFGFPTAAYDAGQKAGQAWKIQ